jgi:hypothetical protein
VPPASKRLLNSTSILQRDGAIECGNSARLVDLAHTTGADGREYFVRAESGSGGETQGLTPFELSSRISDLSIFPMVGCFCGERRG